MKWFILLCLYINIHHQTCLELISSTRSAHLENYKDYVDVVSIHLEIPKEISFASIKIVGDEEKASIFGCTPKRALLYIKPKALPVVNIDNSIIPKDVMNVTRPTPTFIEITSDKKLSFYHNITAPEPGCYYVAATLPYSDPKDAAIKPPGLTPECHTFIQVSLYVEKQKPIEQILDSQVITATFQTNSSRYYKFYVPELVSHAIIIIDKVGTTSKSKEITLRIQSPSLPNANNSLKSLIIESSSANSGLPFNTKSGNWHYIQLEAPSVDDQLLLKFSVKFFFEEFNMNNGSNRIYKSELIENVMPYQQFDLIRESASDSFSFSLELPNEPSNLAINLTNDDFAVLKFKIAQHTDIGGALHFSLLFKPRLNKAKEMTEKEPEDHIVIACLRPELPELPTWPNWCQYEQEQNIAPMILNTTTTNRTMIVPYPDAGTWYASFKLFCGECRPCNCSANCRKQFDECVGSCETTCLDTETCYNCSIDCKQEVVKKEGCGGCDCNGACLKTKTQCNTSIVFDVSSTACVNNCGKNGRCILMISDGFLYSTCSCTNNYRGWDCSDGSNATPYSMVLLELLLLVLSNIMFLPAVYVAYKRHYYIEAICYFSIFFFSTFYHACDAGENIFSYCITRMGALQFADFYCALLSIWVTLIAIADLPMYWPTMCHMLGAIILAFFTTINKMAVWVFILPFAIGVVIIAVSWFFKWKKIKQMFLSKRYIRFYLPLGVLVGGAGLTIYTLLQTTSNYKYLHSAWHMIMAVTVILLLPVDKTFQPETIL